MFSVPQTPEEVELLLQMSDMMLSPEEAGILRAMVTEANTCIDNGDFEGACRVADRLGPEYGTMAREYIKSYANMCRDAAKNSE